MKSERREKDTQVKSSFFHKRCSDRYVDESRGRFGLVYFSRDEPTSELAAKPASD